MIGAPSDTAPDLFERAIRRVGRPAGVLWRWKVFVSDLILFIWLYVISY